MIYSHFEIANIQQYALLCMIDVIKMNQIYFSLSEWGTQDMAMYTVIKQTIQVLP